MKNDESEWQRYERLIACLMVNELSTDLCVTPNARVIGSISGRSRQLDVLIDARHATNNARRIIVDAKMRKRKIDVPQVEAFKGLMEDVEATHGYLICPAGHTAAAERRAQELITLCLVPPYHLDGFDPSKWPKCKGPACAHGRVFWDGYPELTLGLVPVGEATASGSQTVPFLHFVGKCDHCGRFHVQCMTCSEQFSLDDDNGDYRCKCGLPWFWMASIESDERGRRSAELHVALFTGQLITVDRRALE